MHVMNLKVEKIGKKKKKSGNLDIAPATRSIGMPREKLFLWRFQLELKLDAVPPTTQYFQSRSKRDTGSQVRAPRTPASQILSRQEPVGAH